MIPVTRRTGPSKVRRWRRRERADRASVVLAAALRPAVEPDHEHGPEDGGDPPRRVAVVAGEDAHDEAGDERARDAGRHGGQTSHRLPSRPGQPGEGTADEAP